jgi:hypothetical protein
VHSDPGLACGREGIGQSRVYSNSIRSAGDPLLEGRPIDLRRAGQDGRRPSLRNDRSWPKSGGPVSRATASRATCIAPTTQTGLPSLGDHREGLIGPVASSHHEDRRPQNSLQGTFMLRPSPAKIGQNGPDKRPQPPTESTRLKAIRKNLRQPILTMAQCNGACPPGVEGVRPSVEGPAREGHLKAWR